MMESVESTSSPALAINAIDRGTVHQICSGQVVLNLATAVKELVENSLDAGATAIDIRLREFGSELLEVSDNGSGVIQANLQSLTLKHHTSKLKEFTDLCSVETFGFRGEALSSLCALSKLSVSTRHSSSTTGVLATYDHDGHLESSRQQARPVGTTVSLQELFSTMPVRRKEFIRGLKREFSKMSQVLYAYCLVSTGVRISCTNTVGQGKKTTVVSTGGSSVRDNIVSVFGSKQVNTVREVVQQDPSNQDLEDLNLKFGTERPKISLTGYISSCNHGDGRNAGDRQFYFINSRPCDPVKIQKAVNEVYHQFNRQQYPFVFLNISSDRTTVDVNITPDKRQVFLQNEKYLCALVKSSLLSMYEKSPSTYAMSSFQKTPMLNVVHDRLDNSRDIHYGSLDTAKHTLTNEDSSNASEKKVTVSNLKRAFSSSFCASEGRNKSPSKKQAKLDAFLRFPKCGGAGDSSAKVYTSGSGTGDSSVRVYSSVSGASGSSVRDCTSGSGDNSATVSSSDPGAGHSVFSSDSNSSATVYISGSGKQDMKSEVEKQSRKNVEYSSPNKVGRENEEFNASECGADNKSTSDINVTPETEKEAENVKSFQANTRETINNDYRNKVTDSNDFVEELSHQGKRFIDKENIDCNVIQSDVDACETTNTTSPNQAKEEKVQVANSTIELVFDDEALDVRNGKSCNVNFSLERVRAELTMCNKKQVQDSQKYLKFRAKIKPTDDSNAEAELQKEIKKSDFAKMEIFGQFNLGFIIVGLNSDLFIIDQHASDEKYNFETLQQTTVIKSQKMVVPQNLELTVVNESILLDNLNVFTKNGFEFDIDESAPATKKVKLVALPISKNWTFGKEDIDELLFMLQDAPDANVCRPSRVRSMFASRACRKSIMIGNSLNKADMRRLVDHMGQIEQPWNCPHGRPTMRHLVNVDLIDHSDN